jgi:hypothetical protein
MTWVIVTFVAIALVGTAITLLDWLARRKERESQHHPPA